MPLLEAHDPAQRDDRLARARPVDPLARVVQQDEASQGSAEGSYTLEALLDGVVQGSRTQTGLTGTTFTYTRAQYLADDPTDTKMVSFRITPVNGSLEGRVRTTDEFEMNA